MHRAISRVIRGTCRKWRENDVPSVAGEEVRKNQEKDKFVPPRHSFNEALGWTTGLVLTYEVAHRRRNYFRCDDAKESTNTAGRSIFRCPFSGIAPTALTQPFSFSTANHINPVKSKKTGRSKPILPKQPSIDKAPFLHDPILFSDSEESGISTDDNFSFGPQDSFSSTSTTSSTTLTSSKNKIKEEPQKPSNPRDEEKAKKFAGDALNILGVYQYLLGKPLLESNPDTLEMLQNGVDLGSRRALYNLGVIYDRKNEPTIALDYYERAASLGHPLASYNLGCFKIKNGSYVEALKLMKYANEQGVAEAAAAISKLSRVSTPVALKLSAT